MSDASLNIVIDIDTHAKDPEKSDFNQQVAGNIEIMDDRIYISAGNICLGFDRYVLTELIARESKL